jgi:hypothetical protein
MTVCWSNKAGCQLHLLGFKTNNNWQFALNCAQYNNYVNKSVDSIYILNFALVISNACWRKFSKFAFVPSDRYIGEKQMTLFGKKKISTPEQTD